MRLEVGVATDLGRVREANEDAYLVAPPLFAVADGMGGAVGGDVASHLAIETIEQLARRGDGTLAERVVRANSAVYERAAGDDSLAGMGTTITMAALEGSDLHLAHVGDSRAYLLHDDALRQLTQDHTLVARMVRAGEISEAEAEVHPHRNVLIRVLGTEPSVQVDDFSVPLAGGDRALLCSDGLTGMVTEQQIEAILEATPSPQEAAQRLVRAANRAGGIDNITAIVLDAVAEEGDAPLAADSTEAEAEAASALGPAKARAPRPTIARVLIGVGIALVVVALGWIGLRAYVRGQWYVGVADGKVAIFNGIPAEPLGISLADVDEMSDIPAADAEELPIYRTALPEGINANSRAEAGAIVEQIRTDVEEAAAAAGDRGGGDKAGGNGAGTGGGSNQAGGGSNG